MFLPFEFIKYYLVAKGRHGIHSPFVYDFVDKCIKIELDEDFLVKRDQIYKYMQSSTEKIYVSDFGAGSKKLNTNRKISEIFKISSSKGRFADLLYQISNYYKPNNILEFGTSLGIGTLHLQAGNPKAKITTVEACQNTLEIAEKNFIQFGFNIQTICSTFDNYFKNLGDEKFDLIYIDGHHDGQALESYLEKLKPLIHNETILILDDIRWSSSMLNAWNIIKNASNFHVSIDLFRMGLIIQREQQTKQHFVIKI